MEANAPRLLHQQVIELVSIQVALPREHGVPGAERATDRPWTTAFLKEPVAGPVWLGATAGGWWDRTRIEHGAESAGNAKMRARQWGLVRIFAFQRDLPRQSARARRRAKPRRPASTSSE
jgi:hypothetical protein